MIRLCDSCVHRECSKSDNPISTVIRNGVTVSCLDYENEDLKKIKDLKEKEDSKGKEMVNHPSHYNQGIEAIDYIESHKMNFNIGNVIKYVTRAKHKGTELEDLKKASWYLNREIERLEKGE